VDRPNLEYLSFGKSDTAYVKHEYHGCFNFPVVGLARPLVLTLNFTRFDGLVHKTWEDKGSKEGQTTHMLVQCRRRLTR